MKIFSALIAALIIFSANISVFASSAITSDGYCKGIRLWGKVKVVNNFADLKVKVVQDFADLKVKVVQNFPDSLGKWQFVDYGEDFTVEFVENFPDIKIKFVDSFPGF